MNRTIVIVIAFLRQLKVIKDSLDHILGKRIEVVVPFYTTLVRIGGEVVNINANIDCMQGYYQNEKPC